MMTNYTFSRVPADLRQKTLYWLCEEISPDGAADFRLTFDEAKKKLLCNCEKFSAVFSKNPTFRCAHILAYIAFRQNGDRPVEKPPVSAAVPPPVKAVIPDQLASATLLHSLCELAKDLGIEANRESHAVYGCGLTDLTQEAATALKNRFIADFAEMKEKREQLLPEWSRGKMWRCRGDQRRPFIRLVEDLHTLAEAGCGNYFRATTLEKFELMEKSAPFNLDEKRMAEAIQAMEILIGELTTEEINERQAA